MAIAEIDGTPLGRYPANVAFAKAMELSRFVGELSSPEVRDLASPRHPFVKAGACSWHRTSLITRQVWQSASSREILPHREAYANFRRFLPPTMAPESGAVERLEEMYVNDQPGS